MSRLLLAELHRLRSRRLAWVAVVLVGLAVVLLQLAVYSTVKPLTSAELAEGQEQYQVAQKEYQENKAENDAQEQQCVAEGLSEEDCNFEPVPEDYASRVAVPFPEITQLVLTVTVFVSALALMLVGASFIGAEYSTGALANWLSFIPERGKVFASKLLALVLGAVVLGAVAAAATIGLAALVSRVQGAPVSELGKLFGVGGRGVVIAVIAAVVGFALAMLTRHTIAAAGVVLGYLLFAFFFTAVSLSIESLQGLIPWLPENNLLALLNNGYEYQVYVSSVTDEGRQQDSVERTITLAHSVGYWSVILAAVLAVTFVVFRRRDVN